VTYSDENFYNNYGRKKFYGIGWIFAKLTYIKGVTKIATVGPQLKDGIT
jgi:hypothetical protein